MTKYKIFFIWIFAFSNAAMSDDFLDYYINEKSKDTDYLYITEPSEIKNLSSVIYILSDTELSENLQSFFVDYSESLGGKIGGKILDENMIDYFEYLKASHCNITDFSEAVIVYENRISDKCYYFKTNKERELYDALKTIDTSIKDNTSLTIDYSKKKLCKLLDSLKIDTINELKEEFCELFDYLLDREEIKDLTSTSTMDSVTAQDSAQSTPRHAR